MRRTIIMKRKEYKTPSCEVIKLKMEAQLLAGSDPDNISSNFNNEEIDGWVD